MKRSYILFLKDIKEAVLSIFNFVEGMSFEEFCSDDKTQSAVIRKIEVMGEATKNIPHEIIWALIKERLPEIPGLIDSVIQSEQENQ